MATASRRTPRAGVAAAVATLVAAAIALAGAPARDHDGGEATPGGARAAATFTSGSFTMLNSRAGLSIFSADNLAPGGSVTGGVTVTNAGTLGGRFTLSAVDVADTPGPAAGRLSERLQLAVRDITPGGSGAIAYSGALAAMPSLPLGYLRAGEARTYRFTATLPDGGTPPSAAGGDNAYAGSSARVRFVWDAVKASAPAPAPAAPAAPSARPPGDRRAPRLRLSLPPVQRVLGRGYLTVRARCDERCRIDVHGFARLGRRGRTHKLPAIRGVRGRPGSSVRLRVPIPRRLLRPMRRTLVAGGTVSVRLAVVARDRVGNARLARRTVRLRRG